MLNIEPPIEPPEYKEDTTDYGDIADFEYKNKIEQAIIDEYENMLEYVKDTIFVFTCTVQTYLSYKNTRYVEKTVVYCTDDFNKATKHLFDEQHSRNILTLEVWKNGKRLIFFNLNQSKRHYSYENIQKEIIKELKEIE